MINFREIFNIRYGYIGIISIIILILLILVINKKINTNLKIISIISIVSGVLDIIAALLTKVFINILDNSYKVFIEVISDTLYKYLIYIGISLVIIGTIIFIINKHLKKYNN